LYRDTLELLPAAHPNQSGFLHNLALAIQTQFEQSGQREHLDEAIDIYSESIKILPSNHPSICQISTNFGNTLMDAYSHTHESRYLENAMAAYRAAVTCESASASTRFLAARSWAQRGDQSSHGSAINAYQAAIELLPRLAILGSDLQARRRALTSGSDGLARDAAACAIRFGQYNKAVELLKEGRAIFWSQSLQLRTPMTHLREVAPELEGKLKNLSFALERGSLRDVSRDLSDSPQTEMSMEQEAHHMYRLNKEWLETLKEVRQLHSFQDFLRPS
jgi:tetratricopeptide (TPR) repeat protein